MLSVSFSRKYTESIFTQFAALVPFITAIYAELLCYKAKAFSFMVWLAVKLFRSSYRSPSIATIYIFKNKSSQKIQIMYCTLSLQSV